LAFKGELGVERREKKKEKERERTDRLRLLRLTNRSVVVPLVESGEVEGDFPPGLPAADVVC
jgi:hypothetical protein